MLQKQSPAQSVPYLCFGNSKAIWIWSKNCSFRPSPLQFLIATAVLTWLCNFRMQGEESLLSSLLGAPSWIARHTPLPHPVMNLQKHKWPVVVPFPSFVIQDRAAWAARTSYRPQSEQHKPKGQMLFHTRSNLMLPLATPFHTYYYLHPFHFVLSKIWLLSNIQQGQMLLTQGDCSSLFC